MVHLWMMTYIVQYVVLYSLLSKLCTVDKQACPQKHVPQEAANTDAALILHAPVLK